MIRYEAFTKRYGSVTAMAELDLDVAAGDAVALIGPNGSGKTTTLKAPLGLIRPSAGRVSVAGHDTARKGRAVRALIGYLPQRLSFPDGLTAREVLAFYGRLRGVNARDCERLLDRVGLTAAAYRAVAGFSGGMRQRLGIAVALLGRPRALILDEPTAALDPSGALIVRDILSDIRAEGITILLSSHDLADVGALARQVGICLDGRMAAFGAPDDLARELGLPARMRVRLCSHPADVLEAAARGGARQAALTDDVLSCEVQPGTQGTVLEALRCAGTGVADVSFREPGLEEIYRAIAAPTAGVMA